MTDSEMGSGGMRDELVQRLELMETMIAEGRQSTMQCGWVFILWGFVDLVGMAWQTMREDSRWAWPVCIAVGLGIQFSAMALQKRAPCGSNNVRSRSVGAVWSMMGLAMILYVGAALLQHLAWQASYIAGCYMIIGLAHAISATILRWRAQAAVAAIWWVGGVASFFAFSQRAIVGIFLGEMVLGMIAFGVYSMVVERRGDTGRMGQGAR